MVASAEFDPVVVEPHLNPQKIEELFGLKRESAKLDYKRAWDHSSNRDVVELTKDLVAMANTAGGYIVLGIDDAGNEIGLSADEVDRLDEASLRSQVEKFIGTPLELFLDKTIERDSKRYAVITVLKSPRSPVVFQKIGQWTDATPGAKPAIVFREGDVFVRHGSASEKWNQEDVRTIYARVVEREKERWLREVMPDIRKVIEGALQGSPPASAKDLLRTDADTFEKVVRPIVRGSE